MPLLNIPKQEAFAQAYVRGATAGKPAESYLAAGYKVRRRWASVSASRLMHYPGVRRRIAELQRELAAGPRSASESPPGAAAGSTQAPRQVSRQVPRQVPRQVQHGDPMPLINPKQEAFAQAFVHGKTAGDRTHSYLAAGYGCKESSARQTGARLAKQPQVMRRITELRQEMQAREAEASERATERLAITKEAVLSELARIAFANLLDYGKPDDEEGFIFDLSRLDRDKAAAIQEVVVTPVPGAGKDGKPKDGKPRNGKSRNGKPKNGTPKNRIRVKLAPKRDALVDLGRHFGLFVARDKGTTDEFANLSEDELAARIRIVVAELQRIGIDVASLFGLSETGLGGRAPAQPH